MEFLNTPIKGEICKLEMDSPCGRVLLELDDEALIRVHIGQGAVKPGGEAAKTELAAHAERELSAYFGGRLKDFGIPVKPVGTPFQMKVWNALCEIPYGETRSYKEIAEAIGSPKAFRAVGMANNSNPIWVIIPCHRVIGADGSLVGYGGGLEVKEWLLNLERK